MLSARTRLKYSTPSAFMGYWYMNTTILVFLVHLVLSAFMTGVIWFVQLVHYPLFAKVGKQAFKTYERWHTQLTGLLVGPAMVAELFTAIALVSLLPKQFFTLAIVNLVLVIGIWACTFFVQVPLHGQLSNGFDANVISKLVSTNWVRTVLWTIKLIVISYTAYSYVTSST